MAPALCCPPYAMQHKSGFSHDQNRENETFCKMRSAVVEEILKPGNMFYSGNQTVGWQPKAKLGNVSLLHTVHKAHPEFTTSLEANVS